MYDADIVLRHYPPDCQPARIEPLGGAGGMSGAQFWRIFVAPVALRDSSDPAPARTFILRRWPTEYPTPERLRFIHAVLEHVAQCGIPFIPVPIRATTGESFLHHAGHLWELAPWLPGTANYEQAPSVEKLRSALETLAQFHAATADFNLAATGHRRAAMVVAAGASLVISRRLSRLHALANGGHQQLAGAIDEKVWPELAPLARRFLAVLPDSIPRTLAQLSPLEKIHLPLQPCLRDIWHDHVLFTSNEVTGIIDFGAVDIDTPATDIARLLSSLVGDDAASWQIGLDAYSAVRPLSSDEAQAATALDTAGNLLAGCNWIRWIYIDGRQFDDPTQVTQRFLRINAQTQLLSGAKVVNESSVPCVME